MIYRTIARQRVWCLNQIVTLFWTWSIAIQWVEPELGGQLRVSGFNFHISIVEFPKFVPFEKIGWAWKVEKSLWLQYKSTRSYCRMWSKWTLRLWVWALHSKRSCLADNRLLLAFPLHPNASNGIQWIYTFFHCFPKWSHRQHDQWNRVGLNPKWAPVQNSTCWQRTNNTLFQRKTLFCGPHDAHRMRPLWWFPWGSPQSSLIWAWVHFEPATSLDFDLDEPTRTSVTSD